MGSVLAKILRFGFFTAHILTRYSWEPTGVKNDISEHSILFRSANDPVMTCIMACVSGYLIAVGQLRYIGDHTYYVSPADRLCPDFVAAYVTSARR